MSHLNLWINRLEAESRKREIKKKFEKSEYPVQIEIKAKPKSIEYQIKEITAYAPVTIPKKVDESEEVKKFLEEKKKAEKDIVSIDELRSRYRTLAEKESRYKPLSIEVERKIDMLASRYSSKSQI